MSKLPYLIPNEEWPEWFKKASQAVEAVEEKLRVDDADLRMITLVQARFRGRRARRYTKKVFMIKSLVTGMAFSEVNAEILMVSAGWRRFLCHAFMLILLCFTAYSQLLALAPVEHETDGAIRAAAEAVNYDGDSKTYKDVHNTYDIYRYFEAFVNTLYSSDPHFPPTCPPADCLTVLTDSEWFQGCVPQLEDGTGYMDSFNQIQFGALLLQNRRKMKTCSNSVQSVYDALLPPDFFPFYNRRCGTEEITTTYDSIEVQLGRQSKFANITEMVEILPAFSYDDVMGGFTAFLDLGLYNRYASEALCTLDKLEDLNWIDRETSSVCLLMLVHNNNDNGRYGFLRICFDFSIDGYIESRVGLASASVFVFQAHPFGSTVTILYVIWIFVNSVIYVLSVYREYRQFRSRPWRQYVKGSNYISLLVEGVVLGLQIWLCVYFFTVLVHYDHVKFNNSGVDGLYESLTKVLYLVSAYDKMRVGYVVLMLWMVVRTLVSLQFHPSLSIVGETLKIAKTDLISFAIVFLTIVLLYTFIGLLLFNQEGGAFQNFKKSLVNILFLSVGEFGRTSDEIDNQLYARNEFSANLFLWSFVCLTSLILFSVLLSIVVEAYMIFEERKNAVKRLELFESFRISLRIMYYDWTNMVRPYLCCTRRKSDPEAVSDNGSGGHKPSKNRFPMKNSLLTITVPDDAFDALDNPHTFDTRLRLINRWCRVHIQTFLIREEYEKYFSPDQAEKLLAILRERTTIGAFPLVKQELEMFFGKENSDVFIIESLTRILRIIKPK